MTPIEFHTDFEPSKKSNSKGEEIHIYDCPFCEKEQHLYYFPSNTAWDCKVCGKKGNVHVFNQMIYNDVCNKKVDGLQEHWILPKRVFEDIRYNPLNGSWVLPTFRNNKLNNLYKLVEVNSTTSDRSSIKSFGTPGLAATLFDWTDDAHDEIWICEGQKDKLAAEAIIGNAHDVTAVGVPGSNMFKESWMPAFQGKKVVILFDNDIPGEKGGDKIIEFFVKSHLKPASIHRLVWNGQVEGYDLYDLYQEEKGRSWTVANQMFEEVKEEDAVKVTSETIIEDVSCDSYDKALDAFAEAFYITRDMKACLAMCMASIYSINIPGDQLWLKIIGPPGCGKTRIAKAMSASDYVVSKSTFTGLFSGWKDNEDKDPSLVPLITGRTLVVKDADALMRQPNIEKIMSELRDFYDKDSSVHYGNRQAYDYRNIKSTFIMMGTEALRRVDQSFLGERLLAIEMNASRSEETNIKNKALERSIKVALGETADPEDQIMASMKGWINHLRERKLDSTLPEEYKQYILRLCSVTALLRTQCDRDFKGKLRSPAVPELPTRLIAQMVVGSLALCAVYGENSPNHEIASTITKVMRDTMNPRSHRYLICDCMIENPSITVPDLILATKLSKNVVYDEMADLKELNFVKSQRIPGSQPGYSIDAYTLRDEISSPFKEIAK